MKMLSDGWEAEQETVARLKKARKELLETKAMLARLVSAAWVALPFVDAADRLGANTAWVDLRFAVMAARELQAKKG